MKRHQSFIGAEVLLLLVKRQALTRNVRSVMVKYTVTDLLESHRDFIALRVNSLTRISVRAIMFEFI